MVLVVALADLAERLSRLVEGARYIVSVVDARDMRHRIHEHQPEIVVLDWRMGGNKWRAVDEVAAIVDRTQSHPYVIVILPHTSNTIEREAAKVGCYDVVSADDADFDQQVVEAVATAAKAHRRRQVERRRKDRGSLH